MNIEKLQEEITYLKQQLELRNSELGVEVATEFKKYPTAIPYIMELKEQLKLKDEEIAASMRLLDKAYKELQFLRAKIIEAKNFIRFIEAKHDSLGQAKKWLEETKDTK